MVGIRRTEHGRFVTTEYHAFEFEDRPKQAPLSQGTFLYLGDGRLHVGLTFNREALADLPRADIVTFFRIASMLAVFGTGDAQ